MTRSTVLVVSCVLALAASACGDSPVAGPGLVSETSSQAVQLVGVIAMSDDPTPRIGLRRGETLTYLAGNIADLDTHLGETVKVTGAFGQNGEFYVSTYAVEPPPEAAMNRAAP